MKIAVFGAGAIGGLIIARLAKAGMDPLVIARGQTLHTLQTKGIVAEEAGELYQVNVQAIENAENAGPQDILFISLKAHQIAAALPNILPLIGPKTTIIPTINGIPWWYFHMIQGEYSNQPLLSLDPTGKLSNNLPAEQLLGCVVYIAAHCPSPGAVKSIGPRRLILGRCDDKQDLALNQTQNVLKKAGFDIPETPTIRTEIWRKLWGNLFANPLSVLTGAGFKTICTTPDIKEIALDMMREGQEVANHFGIDLEMTVEERLAHAEKLGDFKSSMLQDFEKNQHIELDAILGAVIEMGNLGNVPTPRLAEIYSLVKLRAETHGSWPEVTGPE